MTKSNRVLVTGACGQIGSELTMVLRDRYGDSNVVASDIKSPGTPELRDSGPFCLLDITDMNAIKDVVIKNSINVVYHLAAILSFVAEMKPLEAWNVNMNGLYNVLEVAKDSGSQIFIPSSIAAFGPSTPRDNTPQETVQRPNTMYGVTKVAGELLADYYCKRFGVDARGLRYPGIISHVTLPGGGTTDYAVEIYYEAVKHKKYTCFLKEGTFLDMMYMPDALHAAISLMEADSDKLKHRNAFNVTSMSIAPENIAAEIKKHIPEFVMDYKIDNVRQAIADSWPDSLDDSAAREQWGWEPRYDLTRMTVDMLTVLSKKHAEGKI